MPYSDLAIHRENYQQWYSIVILTVLLDIFNMLNFQQYPLLLRILFRYCNELQGVFDNIFLVPFYPLMLQSHWTLPLLLYSYWSILQKLRFYWLLLKY